jgi:hypothetical protein
MLGKILRYCLRKWGALKLGTLINPGIIKELTYYADIRDCKEMN